MLLEADGAIASVWSAIRTEPTLVGLHRRYSGKLPSIPNSDVMLNLAEPQIVISI
jgi:hypothetical protein